jgi:hypothetical protein
VISVQAGELAVAFRVIHTFPNELPVISVAAVEPEPIAMALM